MFYRVNKARVPPSLRADGEQDGWGAAEVVNVDQFHARSSAHRPVTRARLLYDDAGLYLAFDVEDRYVRCLSTAYQSRVSRDSCVEFFVRPRADEGYFNFEINCGGALLLYYIEDPRRVPGALFRKYTEVPEHWGGQVRIVSSLPPVVFPEDPRAVSWSVRCFIPLRLFSEFVGPIGSPAGEEWSGNFFKCADECSQPHWASWSPIGDELRFHQPQHFAPIRFEP